MKQCSGFVVAGCPFNCASETAKLPKSFAQLKEHLISECPDDLLNCKGCGFEVYKNYAKASPLNQFGHNCLRDNPSSALLAKNMRNIVRRVNSREM